MPIRIRSRIALAVTLLLIIATGTAIGQFSQFGGYQNYGQNWVTGPDGRPNRRGVPDWKVDENFKDDVFTFVRIQYNGSTGRGRPGKWRKDYPDAELNFSYRLQQLTSLHTHPDGLILKLTDPRLFDYPFIYIIEPGNLVFSEDEVRALRSYLFNGGFLMVDDFWGTYELEHFLGQVRRVFPDREATEIPLEHPIFHCVYDLKERPQIPAVGHAHPSRVDENGKLVTWEQGYGTREVHYLSLIHI